MEHVRGLTITDINKLLTEKEISAVELTRSFLDYIEKVDPVLRAFISVTEKEAFAQAEKTDKSIAEGREIGPLSGVPIDQKDNLCTEGTKTTCASKMLENWVSPYSATVVEKLQEAGAVMLGKLNLDEFAMGSSTENSKFFATRNPWDISRVPGGSSGGATAAVAAGEAVYTLGSDTGGSIRQPASFCGVVGLKPSYGRVSRYGLAALASSLDQIGPVTKNVRDCAIVLKAISGYDPRDSTSADIEVADYEKCLTGEIKGLRIGIPKEYFELGCNKEVAETVMKAVEVLEDLGAVCEETSLPHTEYALPAYYVIATAEASSNLARYDGVRFGYRHEEGKDITSMYQKTRGEGFGPEVKRRIMLGTYALSSGNYDAYYLKALKVRTLIKQDFEKAFEKYDALVTPTTPTTAFEFGAKAEDPTTMYQSDLFTVPTNLAGIPAISVPCGLVDGLPVGLQIMAKPFAEDVILRIAYAYENSRETADFLPDLEVKQE